MNRQQHSAPPDKHLAKRRGIVIVAVLLVVVVLSLAAYRYADVMVAEAQVVENVHRAAQTRAFAESGIHYTAALLSNPSSLNTVLNGNPYNNQEAFYNIAVPGDNGLMGRFTIIAPANPTNGTGGNVNTNLYGVTDETGKINLVSWMQIDPTGQQLFYMLSALPNMTPQIAYNIIAWMGGSYGIANGGAQDDYYQSLTPPYRCKNNVPDSLDELLLVQGVTRDLLYGADADRNGVQNGNEPPNTSSTVLPASGFDRGWSAFLTIYSREQNSDVNGNPYMWINNTDLQQLYSAVSVNVDDNLAKFIVMYRQYGPASASGGSQSLANTLRSVLGGSTPAAATTVQGSLSTYQLQYTKSGKTNFTSFFQLVNASVNIQSTDPQSGKTITTTYASPLNSTANQQTLLPLLFQNCTLSQNAEIPARINVNTAPQEILTGLEGIGGNSSGLADTDVQNIIQMRQLATGQPGDIYATPAWLLTEAKISPKVLALLDMNYITTRSQVYRVQSVGYFDNGKGPTVRVEAIIDTQCPTGADPNTAFNPGRPRIIAWRNLSDLGKGWTDPNGPNANSNP